MKATGSCASLQVMVELARVNAPIMLLFSEALETAEYNNERIIQNAKGGDYHEMIQNIRV